MPWLFLLFIAVPLLEIYLFIHVGGMIGAGTTVLLVVCTAFIGVTVLRLQGIYTWGRVRAQWSQGQIPALEMLEGVALLLAGALLITPGFFTDTLGFLLLIPAVRRALLRRLLRHLTSSGPPGQGGSRSSRSHRILEGEFHRED